MTEQAEPPEPSLAAAQQQPPAPSAGGSKRPIALVTRDELRDLNREKRRKYAVERRGKLLETFKHAKAAAEAEDGWLDRVEAAPVYTPTAEEWEDPLAYIRSIASEAGQYGLCIVRAPIAPSMPGGMVLQLGDPGFKFRTRQQALRDRPWKDWQGVTFLPGKRYSLKEFQDTACVAAAKRFGGLHGCLPTRTLEREYWREREKAVGAPVLVEYGSDVDGSLFTEEDRLGATRWNLNALPTEPRSALRHCDDRGIPGVTRPMLYVGQLFSTFAWHVEDHFMFSINYQHLGAAKLWYGVPASNADEFEAVARQQSYGPAAEQTLKDGGSEAEVWAHVERALMGKTTMLSPRHLLDAGVKVYRVVQQPGDYVITFPRAYHAGWGCGFQVGEAVNFAMDEWWPFGENARQRYRRMRHPAIIAHEQLLCDEALALAAEWRRRRSSAAGPDKADGDLHVRGATAAAAEGEDEKAQLAPSNALAYTFVAAMRRLNRCRAALEAAGAVPLSACPSDSSAARQSLHCCTCQQSVYAASVVLQPVGQPDSWRHMCLECAADEVAGQQDATQAAAGAVVFVKPCWEELEACALELEQDVEDPADTPLPLLLVGTNAQQRYGSGNPPGFPSPCQPYSWSPLQQPHSEWPAALLQRLAQAAGPGAPAAPTPDAVAGVAAAAAAVSPEAAFQVALKHEAEQAAAAAAEPADPPAEAAAAGGAAAAAAAAAAPAAAGAKRGRGRRRGRGQPAGEEEDEDALEALPLESEAAIEVEGHRVQRHIHSDGGEPVLVGSEALEAVLGGARDKKESAAKKLGSWLRKCGGSVSKAKLAGPGRHQAVALLRREDAAALLGSEELDPERWERLRLFISGIWPDLDAQLEAGTLKRSATLHTRSLDRQASAGGRPAQRRRGSTLEPGSTEAAAAAHGAHEEELEVSEDTPLSELTGDEQQGWETGVEVAQVQGGWEPSSKRRRASTTVAGVQAAAGAAAGGVAGTSAAAVPKQEQPAAAANGNGAAPAMQQAAAHPQEQQAVQAMSVEDAAQMLAAAGPELLAALMQQGVSLEDPAVMNAVVAQLERALAPQ